MSRSKELCAVLGLAVTLSLSFSCSTRRAAATSSIPTAAPEMAAASELTNATLWVQTAAEYRACTTVIYRAAREAMDAALHDTMRSAAAEQSGSFANLPPAVILDIDETVLDNSPYQAHLVMNNTAFDAAGWSEWVELARAAAVAGAPAFLNHAVASGVEVFYVTNRTHAEEPATRRNLQSLGLPVKESPDTLLTRGEMPEWGSDKSSRRAYVSRTYRVLLLLGDDLGDFLPAGESSLQERDELVEREVRRWGRDWFMLPNPQYGSWERALYGHRRDLADAQLRAAKRKALRPYR